ncbi:PREDICTED: magnesium transporter NIPA2-like, partial [Priapulus caudatus]|uniref:Magnesium transporter NIPA2-like n=1 Tax=Priapulus caudatus TaxID=37621 RepID=A0ABM1F5A2_PRICU
SSVFIGSSFIIKKKGLLRVSGTRAGQGGYAYLKEWLWWTGLMTMAFGEAENFVAYAFAPATLVTPLGALSVIVSAVLASRYLNERLNILGKLGCFLCMVGALMIIIHSPKEPAVDTMEELAAKLVDPAFVTYAFVVVVVVLVLIFYYAPRHGSDNILVYIAICSLVGSLSVMACKGVGVALSETFSGGSSSEFANPLTWFFVGAVAVCVTVQMNYLNRALDTFNTSVVSPIYYVFFTTFTIVASALLFQEWRHLAAQDVVGILCGFATIVGAIFLLHAFRDVDLSVANFREVVRALDARKLYEKRKKGHHGSSTAGSRTGNRYEPTARNPPSQPHRARTHSDTSRSSVRGVGRDDAEATVGADDDDDDEDKEEAQRRKTISRVVMVTALLLLTMCVVLVGTTLGMANKIDDM